MLAKDIFLQHFQFSETWYNTDCLGKTEFWASGYIVVSIIYHLTLQKNYAWAWRHRRRGHLWLSRIFVPLKCRTHGSILWKTGLQTTAIPDAALAWFSSMLKLAPTVLLKGVKIYRLRSGSLSCFYKFCLVFGEVCCVGPLKPIQLLSGEANFKKGRKAKHRFQQDTGKSFSLPQSLVAWSQSRPFRQVTAHPQSNGMALLWLLGFPECRFRSIEVYNPWEVHV